MAFVLPIEELMAKVSDQAPCGVLEESYAGQIDALWAGVRSKPAETTFRDGEKIEIRPAQEPDWSQLASVAEALFRGAEAKNLTAGADSGKRLRLPPIKHLGPAIVLTLASLQTDGLPGLADGLELIRRLLDEYWDSLYPLPVDDPEAPFYKRANLLAPLERPFNELNDSWRVVERVYAATLIESGQNGALSVRDCLAPWATGLQLKLPEGKSTTAAMITSALAQAAERQQRQEVLKQALTSARKIEETFREKAADKGTPHLDELATVLEAAASVLDGKAPVGGGVEVGGGAGSGTGAAIGGGFGTLPPTVTSGPIASRSDAVMRLSEVADYFRQNEACSPVPFLLERVQRVIGKDFLGLLEEFNELGDQALPGFKKLAGVKDKPPETQV